MFTNISYIITHSNINRATRRKLYCPNRREFDKISFANANKRANLRRLKWTKEPKMSTLLIVLHVIVALALIVIVLLQMGKGAQAGASFGAGGSQAMFGTTGGNFMSKVTAAAAIIFMLTSLSLAYFHSSPDSKSVMPSVVAPESSAATTDVPTQEK
jgi:preprotein translocase subunit SecG